MEEFKRLLEESIKDEMADHEKYVRMSAMAKELGRDDLAKILKDISSEEEIHYTFVKAMLESL